jgi:hypothetical protein
MEKRWEDHLALQRAKREAEDAIRDIAGLPKNLEGGTFLVTDFGRRYDLPASASQRRISTTVAKKLAEVGLREPVSLRLLPNRWWKTHIDAAEVGLLSEYGCAMVTRLLSTAQLADLGFEVVDGPFREWENEEVSRLILKSNPGRFWDARISRVDARPGHTDQLLLSGGDSSYTSEALTAALDQGDTIQVFSGPYGSEDEARCAGDVRWEVPD